MQVRTELKTSMQFIVVEKNGQMCFNENVKKPRVWTLYGVSMCLSQPICSIYDFWLDRWGRREILVIFFLQWLDIERFSSQPLVFELTRKWPLPSLIRLQLLGLRSLPSPWIQNKEFKLHQVQQIITIEQNFEFPLPENAKSHWRHYCQETNVELSSAQLLNVRSDDIKGILYYEESNLLAPSNSLLLILKQFCLYTIQIRKYFHTYEKGDQSFLLAFKWINIYNPW